MVVKHNLTAINANRNFNTVVGKQQKDTEKLSSGYKVNRAADDAAGLSISEKMRRQVRGLTQASLNTQDGISFVQSAEGALNEVHDMLQRGNELAVKAANDTNMAEDREAIYAEIQQLNREIDRIARDSRFNELEMFDSSNADPSGKNSRHVAGDYPEMILLDGGYMTYDMQDFSSAITQAANAGKVFTQAGLEDFANQLKSTYMPKLLGNIVNSLPNSAKPTVSGLQISLNMCYENSATLAYVSSNGIRFQLGVNMKYLTESGGKITMSDDLASTIAHEMTHAVMFDAVTNGMLGSGGADKFPMWFIEGTAQAVGGAMDDYCSSLKTAINQGDDAVQKWLSKLTDTSDMYTPYMQGYIGSMYLGYVAGGGGAVDKATIAKGLDNILKDIEDGYSLGQAISRQTNGKYGDLADFEGNFAKDAVSFAKELVKASGSGTGSIISPSGLSGGKNTLLQGGATSNYFVLNVDQNNHYDNSGVLGGKNTYTGGGATTTGGLDRDGNTNPDASKSWGSSLSGNQGTVQRSGSMFVHVGAESGQHISFSTFKLSAKDLGLADIKVDSMENAGKAIDKYKKAIQCVSTMRSEYGAVQNRLEHTGTNLDNIVENTQAAESAIRDTDIADTMLEYSVNNILAQAGTSMLTQANQSKQLALELLG